MKKIVWLSAILACFLLFSSRPARAASELEVWCHAQGETWDSDVSICYVIGHATISSPLHVLFGERIANLGTIDNNSSVSNGGTIFNAGAINNAGNIYNSGTFSNFSTINNSGTISTGYGTFNNAATLNNDGTFENYDVLNNYGIINNDGTINNRGMIRYQEGVINNYGIIDNRGTINNYGSIYIFCSAVYRGSPPVENSWIPADASCSYLPGVLGP